MKTQKDYRRYLPLLIPLIAMILTGLLAMLRTPAQMWLVEAYKTQQDPILMELQTGYAVNRIFYIITLIQPFLYAAAYIILLLIAKLMIWHRARKAELNADNPLIEPKPESPIEYLNPYEDDDETEDSFAEDEAGEDSLNEGNNAVRPPKQKKLTAKQIWKITHIVSILCFVAVIFSSRQMLYGSYGITVQNVRLARDAFQADLQNYQSGRLATYQGLLTLDGYIESDPDRPFTGNGYYAFSTESSDHLWLRCPKASFNGAQLLLPSYEAKYLPNTLYVVSITGPDGQELLGVNPMQDLPPNQWAYGDVILEKSIGIPGYDELNQEQQRLFDLMNSGVLWNLLQQQEQGVYSFPLEVPLTKDEFRAVSRLYQRTNAIEMKNFPLFGYYYQEGSRDEPASLNLQGKDYGWRICRLYGPIFRQRAKEIAGSLTASGEEGKCREITDYLLNHVTPVEKAGGPPENEWDFFPDTGFGALINRAGDSEGFAVAFDAIARSAGLTAQLMERDDKLKGQQSGFWNTVRLENGEWLKIDAYALALEKNAGHPAESPASQTDLFAAQPAGGGGFDVVDIPADWVEATENKDIERIYSQPGGNSQIGFRKLEAAGAGSFNPKAAAKSIRTEIEAQGGVIYTDFPEYISPECPSHLLCAALPDGMFLITWIYPRTEWEGCSLWIYGASENIIDLYATVKQTFSMQPINEAGSRKK